jgi:phage-related protein
MKDLEFIGSSQDDLKHFPADVRRAAGFQLHYVQQGLLPTDWKPMYPVGAGAMEIRIHDGGEWRVIYVARFAHAVYVLHAFSKKTGATSKADIELARSTYREVERREKVRQKR